MKDDISNKLAKDNKKIARATDIEINTVIKAVETINKGKKAYEDYKNSLLNQEEKSYIETSNNDEDEEKDGNAIATTNSDNEVESDSTNTDSKGISGNNSSNKRQNKGSKIATSTISDEFLNEDAESNKTSRIKTSVIDVEISEAVVNNESSAVKTSVVNEVTTNVVNAIQTRKNGLQEQINEKVQTNKEEGKIVLPRIEENEGTIVLPKIEEEKIVSKIDAIARKTKIESSEEHKIKQILSWKYKFEGLEQIPTKTSVTKIKEQDLWNEEERTKLKINQAFEEMPNSDEEKEGKDSTSITAKPKFLNEEARTKISNAEKGTLMHLCVQKMDEKQEYDLQKIDEMLLALETKEIITGLEAENINKSKLLEYTKSELWQELKEAKEIQKEHPFYINVKASAIYENISKEADEKILVQGVIDLYFINKNDELVLIDYKTDYVPEGQEFTLVEKYKKQLELYKVALEQSVKRKVDKMAIYSLYLNKLIEMK